MTSSKSTKRALVSSALAIVMCVAMLIGATFAWFTDTASTGVNKIQAGNLDVKLMYSTDMQTWKEAPIRPSSLTTMPCGSRVTHRWSI